MSVTKEAADAVRAATVWLAAVLQRHLAVQAQAEAEAEARKASPAEVPPEEKEPLTFERFLARWPRERGAHLRDHFIAVDNDMEIRYYSVSSHSDLVRDAASLAGLLVIYIDKAGDPWCAGPVRGGSAPRSSAPTLILYDTSIQELKKIPFDTKVLLTFSELEGPPENPCTLPVRYYVQRRHDGAFLLRRSTG